MIQSPLLSRFPELVHGFSTKENGLPGDGNMSMSKGERNEVIGNRSRFCAGLGLSLESIVMADQIHSARVFPVTLKDRGKGAQTLSSPLGEGDALCTQSIGITLTVLVADCAAVFCYDAHCRALGLAHSGWRGTALSIVPQLIQTMNREYGTKTSNLHVWVSPAIGVCCFEVGSEVLDLFRQEQPHLANRGDWYRPIMEQPGKYHLDIKALIREQALTTGVPPQQIELAQDCTYCSNRYHSYRRIGRKTGHMMALLALRENTPS